MMFSPEPSDHLRIVAIIQARMGSTRLPGKVLMPVAGKPLIWHVVNRLRRSQLIEQIAIATTTLSRDNAIADWGRDNDVPVVRGPEDDVVGRFARAAELLDADVIVRVSSDAPFIDPGFVDHLVTALLEQDGDYVLLEEGAVTAHEGVDPFTRRALDKLMMDAHDDPVAREHVTGYFKVHPEFVRIARAAPYPVLARPAGRLTIDTPDDLTFAELIHERMAARAGEASLADLLALLEREPQLRQVNAHVRQKPVAAAGGLALIRCDGGGKFGYGHVKRMVALACALRDREGIGSRFCVHGSADVLAPIRSAAFEASLLDPNRLSEDFVQAATVQSPDIVVCDAREGVTSRDLQAIPSRPLIAVVDDASDLRLAADFAYYPPVPQTATLDWKDARTCVRVGWEWALLGSSASAPPALRQLPRPTVLVTMGGSDPMGLTLGIARALCKLDPLFRARFVIGPGVKDGIRAAKVIVSLAPHFETVEGASDLATEFAAADLAVAAFGVTAYELAAAGVPAVYVCLTPDHALSASAFERAGIGISLGVAERIAPEDVARTVWALLTDRARLREMRTTGLDIIDGEGANRVAADLARALSDRRSSAVGRIAR